MKVVWRTEYKLLFLFQNFEVSLKNDVKLAPGLSTTIEVKRKDVDLESMDLKPEYFTIYIEDLSHQYRYPLKM